MNRKCCDRLSVQVRSVSANPVDTSTIQCTVNPFGRIREQRDAIYHSLVACIETALACIGTVLACIGTLMACIETAAVQVL